MNILVDIRPLFHDSVPEEAGRFIIRKLFHLSGLHKEHGWYFLADQRYDEMKWNTPAEKNIIIQKTLPGKIGLKIWQGWQMQNLVKKYRAGLLISTGGIASNVSIPQATWIPASAKNSGFPGNKKYFRLFKKSLGLTLQKSAILLVFSEKLKQEFISDYGLGAGKPFLVVHPDATEAGSPLSWPERESIKTKYTGGKDYFAVTGDAAAPHIINLLKAFSQFKKWQQSNMQLVILLKGIASDFDFSEKLETYKFRSEVVVCDNMDERETDKMLSGAYCIVCAPDPADPGALLLRALKAEVPVISNSQGNLAEMAGDVVLYADIESPESVGGQLIKIYKDENLRGQLIEKGRALWPLYDEREINEGLWRGMEQVLNNNKTE